MIALARIPDSYPTIDAVVNPLAAHYLAAHAPEGQAVGDHDYERDLPEANRMQRRFGEYLQREGSILEQYLGRRKRPIVGAGKLPEQAVAATVKTNDGLELVLANRGYASRVQRFAADHGLNWDLANTYILAHEHVHLLDRQMRSRSPIGSEGYVEATLLRYFTQRAMQSKGAEREKYQKLASTAKQRLQWLKGMSNKQYEKHVAVGDPHTATPYHQNGQRPDNGNMGNGKSPQYQPRGARGQSRPYQSNPGAPSRSGAAQQYRPSNAPGQQAYQRPPAK